jgi:hypothetical protein
VVRRILAWSANMSMVMHVLEVVIPIHKLATIVSPVNTKIKMKAMRRRARHVVLANPPPLLPWRVLIVLLDKVKKKVNHFLQSIKMYCCCQHCSNINCSFFSNTAESTMYGCKKCTKGKIAATSSTVCLDCEIGKYQPLDIATTNACSDCGGGQFAASKSAADCSICGKGQFQDENAAVDHKCAYYTSVLILVVVGILTSSSSPSFFFPRQSVCSWKLSKFNRKYSMRTLSTW